MITTPLLSLILTHAPGSMKVTDCLFAPIESVKKVMGNQVPSGKADYTVFKPAGFDHVYVYSFGKGMKMVDVFFSGLIPWSQATGKLGLSAKSVHPTKNNSFYTGSAVNRNRVDLNGLVCKSSAASDKRPWTVAYDEWASIDSAKLKALKPQIKAAAGAQRQTLINSCYIWHTALHFTAPK